MTGAMKQFSNPTSRNECVSARMKHKIKQGKHDLPPHPRFTNTSTKINARRARNPPSNQSIKTINNGNRHIFGRIRVLPGNKIVHHQTNLIPS
mmetsp:Transcript_16393/g.34259  ORF Transcript_16393/g.34259 Transcript_16393/m.34259 type:complete len:93 (+) Transcript_16393:225-503(+)